MKKGIIYCCLFFCVFVVFGQGKYEHNLRILTNIEMLFFEQCVDSLKLDSIYEVNILEGDHFCGTGTFLEDKATRDMLVQKYGNYYFLDTIHYKMSKCQYEKIINYYENQYKINIDTFSINKYYQNFFYSYLDVYQTTVSELFICSLEMKLTMLSEMCKKDTTMSFVLEFVFFGTKTEKKGNSFKRMKSCEAEFIKRGLDKIPYIKVVFVDKGTDEPIFPDNSKEGYKNVRFQIRILSWGEHWNIKTK